MKTKPNGVLKIEKGIPVPPKGGKSGMCAVLRQLGVGDSILVHGSRSTAANVSQHILGAGNYTCRKDGDGFRVWRTK